MSCDKCVDGKIVLFTSVEDCECTKKDTWSYPLDVSLPHAQFLLGSIESLDEFVNNYHDRLYLGSRMWRDEDDCFQLEGDGIVITGHGDSKKLQEYINDFPR